MQNSIDLLEKEVLDIETEYPVVKKIKVKGGSETSNEDNLENGINRSKKKNSLTGRMKTDFCNLTEEIRTPDPIDPSLFSLTFPKEHEGEFAAAIFDLGLKYSSPKILMSLMPEYSSLTTEHIKSHLQKYRIHMSRSKEEFLQFYDMNMRDSFEKFEATRGWEVAYKRTLRDMIDEYPPNGNVAVTNNAPPLQAKSKSEVILEQAELMMADWGLLFENLMMEHANVQQSLKMVIEGNSDCLPVDTRIILGGQDCGSTDSMGSYDDMFGFDPVSERIGGKQHSLIGGDLKPLTTTNNSTMFTCSIDHPSSFHRSRDLSFDGDISCSSLLLTNLRSFDTNSFLN